MDSNNVPEFLRVIGLGHGEVRERDVIHHISGVWIIRQLILPSSLKRLNA